MSVNSGSSGEPGAVCPLRLGVGLDERDARGLAPGRLEIAERLRVDREEAAGRAVFGRHVGDRRAVGDRHRVEARAVELDELADHALLAQHLGHGQHEVGRGDALAQLARQLEADHLRQEHRERLAEHRRFRFDAADPPAENGEAVDHGGVAVGADQRIGKGDLDRLAVALLLRRPHGLGEIFEIDLMADAGAGRHDREVGEGLLAPLQKAIALLVLLVFARHILPERFAGAEIVDDNGMVDHEIDRHERIDLARITAERGHRVAHGGEIDDGGHAGEVLHQHPRRTEGDLMLVPAAVLRPGRHRLDVFLLDGAAVFVAQQIFEHDLERERQLRHPGEAVLLRRLQRVNLVGLRPNRQRFAALKLSRLAMGALRKAGTGGMAAYR